MSSVVNVSGARTGARTSSLRRRPRRWRHFACASFLAEYLRHCVSLALLGTVDVVDEMQTSGKPYERRWLKTVEALKLIMAGSPMKCRDLETGEEWELPPRVTPGQARRGSRSSN